MTSEQGCEEESPRDPEQEDLLVRQVYWGLSFSPRPKMGAAQLRGVLLRAQQRMDAEHRVATSTWRAPLSLFDERQASSGGIPDWAIRTVLKARRLVEQAAGLGDLTDVYEAQILTAQREKRGIARAPL
eukprot:s1083_g2.t1